MDRPTSGSAATGSLLLTPLLALARSLRRAGVPVSASEMIDATGALNTVDGLDRDQVHAALAATMIKRADDRATFDSLFAIHFAIRSPRRSPLPGSELAPQGLSRLIETSLDRPAEAANADLDADPSTELLEALLQALRSGDTERLRELADLAVTRFGGMQTQAAASERYFLYRVLRALELSELMARLLRVDRDEAAASGDEPTLRADLAERIETFKKMLAEQVRAHLAELRGADDAARGLSHLSVDETDFLGASPRQLAQMREQIRPLARSLATRIERRRRRRDRGRLDVRRTVRRSMSYGGVPLDPAFRRPRVARPDLFLLCDVSGSVAEFASFTLTLLQAMAAEFPRLRSFAFVDAVDEVTQDLHDVASFLEVRHVLYRADVVRADGHSDYGSVLQQFWDRFGTSIDARSTVILTGDLRSNHRDPRADALHAIHARARRCYVLNPEARADWNTTDSIVSVYEPSLDGVFEVRNLAQLAEAVVRIA